MEERHGLGDHGLPLSKGEAPDYLPDIIADLPGVLLFHDIGLRIFPFCRGKRPAVAGKPGLEPLEVPLLHDQLRWIPTWVIDGYYRTGVVKSMKYPVKRESSRLFHPCIRVDSIIQ
jgi:hypothetical protein